MSSLEERKAAVLEEFSMYDEWLDKYEYLIELGKSLEAYPESEKTDDKMIKGCQSRVWLNHWMDRGKLYFGADSDAIITKGIISLLIRVYSGATPAEIAADDFAFIADLGLKENLSPTRANGLVSMMEFCIHCGPGPEGESLPDPGERTGFHDGDHPENSGRI